MGRSSCPLAAVIFVTALAAPGAAHAQLSFPPLTSRNFNIDLFEQPALGSPRLIAMSGAIDAVAEGAAGLYTNPASRGGPAGDQDGQVRLERLFQHVRLGQWPGLERQRPGGHQRPSVAPGGGRAPAPIRAVGPLDRRRLHGARDRRPGRRWPGRSLAHRPHRPGADLPRPVASRWAWACGLAAPTSTPWTPALRPSSRGSALPPDGGRRLAAQGTRLSLGRQRRTALQHLAHPVQLRSESTVTATFFRTTPSSPGTPPSGGAWRFGPTPWNERDR